jgi:hypothetical protein
MTGREQHTVAGLEAALKESPKVIDEINLKGQAIDAVLTQDRPPVTEAFFLCSFPDENDEPRPEEKFPIPLQHGKVPRNFSFPRIADVFSFRMATTTQITPTRELGTVQAGFVQGGDIWVMPQGWTFIHEIPQPKKKNK